MEAALNLKSEPPSRDAKQDCLLIGRDSHGHWVVRDQKGMYGGIFVDRARALKYAMQDLGRGMRAIIMMPGVLELDMSAAPPATLRVSARLRRVGRRFVQRLNSRFVEMSQRLSIRLRAPSV